MDSVLALVWLLSAWLGGANHDPACLLLGGLDAVRAEAFVTGDARRLMDVYADERAARPDVEMLQSYRARDLQLRGMRLERKDCRVRTTGAGRIALDVVDRLERTAVRTPDGSWRDLPRDQWSRHVVVLRRVGDAWRVASVSSRRSSRR